MPAGSRTTELIHHPRPGGLVSLYLDRLRTCTYKRLTYRGVFGVHLSMQRKIERNKDGKLLLSGRPI